MLYRIHKKNINIEPFSLICYIRPLLHISYSKESFCKSTQTHATLRNNIRAITMICSLIISFQPAFFEYPSLAYIR